jgi:iron complex outermembrane receptor protein
VQIRSWKPAFALIVATACALGHNALAQTTTQNFKQLTLEELMKIEISLVSRTPEPVVLTPAAAFVITQQDIQRAGVTSLAEALRLAPGVHVARIDASRWAVGVRGFADRLARSMLVLIDGRAVYNPLFAGTYWEVQDALLHDIERIEIIRGPGGTLWGANAVNGIINIVTKHARDTQGLLAKGLAGTEDPGGLALRYGNTLGTSGHLRSYFRGFSRGPQFHADSLDYDDWWKLQGGFRSDWSLSQERTATVQGDIYLSRLGARTTATSYLPPFSQVSTAETPLSGGNVLARWAGPNGQPGSFFQLQTYYDRTRREERPVQETRDTFDVDFQQRQAPWKGHQATWGAGYRVSSDRIVAVEPSAFIPPNRTDNLYTAFVQDETGIVRARLRFTVGAKFEHNAYSGFEFQPSGRLLWEVDSVNAIVASVTRAVRTPSRVETDYTTTSLVSPATPTFVRLLPNPEFRPEELIAYELGYRVRPDERVYFTASGFFNQLDDLLSTELATPFVETSPPPPARLILPVSFLNGIHGSSHGVELTADVRPTPWWRSTVNYSYLQVRATPDPGSRDVSQQRRYEGLSPRHQVHLRAAVDLPRNVSVDWLLRYVSELPAGPVPAYATSDIRVAWQPYANFEIAVVGKDLHEAQHLEWPTGAGANIQIQRSAYVSVTWQQ